MGVHRENECGIDDLTTHVVLSEVAVNPDNMPHETALQRDALRGTEVACH
jgi:hypothetical protein